MKALIFKYKIHYAEDSMPCYECEKEIRPDSGYLESDNKQRFAFCSESCATDYRETNGSQPTL